MGMGLSENKKTLHIGKALGTIKGKNGHYFILKKRSRTIHQKWVKRGQTLNVPPGRIRCPYLTHLLQLFN